VKFCTGLQVVGSGAAAAGGTIFLVGSGLDGTGIGATIGVPLQTFGTIGAVMGGVVIGIGYIGEKIGICE
jgi:hypothetical protein